MIGSKVMAILPHREILPIGEVVLGLLPMRLPRLVLYRLKTLFENTQKVVSVISKLCIVDSLFSVIRLG